MRHVLLITMYVFLIQGLLPLLVTAQTNLSGTCSGTFTPAGNPHRLTGDCTVPAGETLTVESGVTIMGVDAQGATDRLLRIDGTLTADGATFTNVRLLFQTGSGGQVQNSLFNSFRTPLTVSGSSVDNPVAPIFIGNTLTAGGDVRFTVSALTVEGTAQPTITNNIITSDRTCIIYQDSAAGMLLGNTLTCSFSGIDIQEAAQPTLTNNTINTLNAAVLTYSETAAGTATGNTLGFIAGSQASNRRVIRINGGASPLIDGNTLRDDTDRNDIALHLAINTTSSVTVTNNSICASGDDTPFLLVPEFFETRTDASVTDNTLVCERDFGIALTSGTVTSETLLDAVNGISTFVLQSTFFVGTGGTLAIAPGNTIAGSGNNLTIEGALSADGVTFVDTRFDFNAGSMGTLRNNVLRSEIGLTTAVLTIDGNVTFTNNLIDGFPIVMDLAGMAQVDVRDNTFRNNGNVFNLGSAQVMATIAANVFESNTNLLTVPFANPEVLFAPLLSHLDDNTFLGRGDHNTILISSLSNVSGTLQATTVPYACDRSLTIGDGEMITLQPGTVIQGTRGCSITVNGDLHAVGTLERPIIFTAALPETGVRWRGLTFRNKDLATTDSVLENCVVQFAGALNGPGIFLENASIPIRHCAIVDNLFNGITAENSSAPLIEGSAIVQNLLHGIQSHSGSTPLIRNSSLFGNGSNGLQNDDATVVINAENNFWGDDSGPRDLASDRRCNTLANADGLGEDVSDCVDFDPWQRLGPSIEGVVTVVSGAGQVGEAGTILPDPLVVAVQSFLGAPLANVEVLFSVVRGDAAFIETMPLRTDADGRAAATVQLGITPGEVRIVATVRDVNSPLAMFLGESNAPCLFVMQITGDCQRNGDINGDGRVTPADARLVFRHAMGEPEATLGACQQAHADVAFPPPGLQRDITAADALCILRHFLGQSSCLDSGL